MPLGLAIATKHDALAALSFGLMAFTVLRLMAFIEQTT
jgi:hypothetical protein